MKQVFTAENRLITHHYKNLLESEGIDCLIKNDALAPMAGELAPDHSWPELWVMDSNYASRAKTLISQSENTEDSAPDWICKQCGEKHPSGFTHCWNCQAVH